MSSIHKENEIMEEMKVLRDRVENLLVENLKLKESIKVFEARKNDEVKADVDEKESKASGEGMDLFMKENQLTKFTKLITPYIKEKSASRPLKIAKTKLEIEEKMNFKIDRGGCSDEEIFRLMNFILEESVDVYNPLYLNQVYTYPFDFGLLGSWITDFLKNSVAAFYSSPVATVLEKSTIEHLCNLVGYECDWKTRSGNGALVYSGSGANTIGIMLALRKKLNTNILDVKETGYNGSNCVILKSEFAHFSASQAANRMGIGSKNVHDIPVDGLGKIIVDELEKSILNHLKDGKDIVCVVITFITAITGSIDDVGKVASICRKYDIPLHVDACVGGPFLYLDQCEEIENFEYLKKCISEANSIALDTHKGFGTKLSTGVILTKKSGVLADGFLTSDTEYLFHNNTENIGINGLRAAKAATGIALALNLKRYGRNGFQNIARHQLAIAKYMEDKVKGSEVLELVIPRQTIMVNFRYPTGKGRESDSIANKKLHDALERKGIAFVSYSDSKRLGFCFRPCFSNPSISKSDIDHLVRSIEKEVYELNVE